MSFIGIERVFWKSDCRASWLQLAVTLTDSQMVSVWPSKYPSTLIVYVLPEETEIVAGRVRFSTLLTPGWKGPWNVPADKLPTNILTLVIGFLPYAFSPRVRVA